MRSVLKFVGGCALVGITWFGIAHTLFRNWEERMTRPVGEKLPDIFPVLVTTSNKARIVWGEDLDEFKRAHPDYSFLVPFERREAIQQEIFLSARAQQTPMSFDASTGIPWSARFEVTALPDGRQSFVVHATFDDDRVNIGWYDASSKELFPRSHRFYFGPGLAIDSVQRATMWTAAIWGIPVVVWLLWKRLRPAAGAAA